MMSEMFDAGCERLLSPRELARLFGVSATTVSEWVREKRLAGVKRPAVTGGFVRWMSSRFGNRF
jgi:excisionase family DNA binding protein